MHAQETFLEDLALEKTSIEIFGWKEQRQRQILAANSHWQNLPGMPTLWRYVIRLTFTTDRSISHPFISKPLILWAWLANY